MPAAVEGRIQKFLDAVLCRFLADQAFAEREDVGVVVLAREPGHQPVHAKRRAGRRMPVGRDRYSNSRAADDDAPRRLAVTDGLRDRSAEVWIIKDRKSTRLNSSH